MLTDGCAALPAGTQTSNTPSPYPVADGTAFTFECNEGYVYVGDSAALTVTCASGSWSSTTTACQSTYTYFISIL